MPEGDMLYLPSFGAACRLETRNFREAERKREVERTLSFGRVWVLWVLFVCAAAVKVLDPALPSLGSSTR